MILSPRGGVPPKLPELARSSAAKASAARRMPTRRSDDAFFFAGFFVIALFAAAGLFFGPPPLSTPLDAPLGIAVMRWAPCRIEMQMRVKRRKRENRGEGQTGARSVRLTPDPRFTFCLNRFLNETPLRKRELAHSPRSSPLSRNQFAGQRGTKTIDARPSSSDNREE